ncbi:E3 RID-alpha [Human adenovirus 1]|nr:E3 RID-alpha [Human adenovirus 1]
MIPRVLILLTLIALFCACSTLAAVAHIEVDCIPPFTVYLLYGFVTLILICSLVTVVIAFIQFIDWVCVRIAYLRHHPQYRDTAIAELLRIL